MKKKILKATVILAATVGLSACGAAPASPAYSSGAVTVKASEGGTDVSYSEDTVTVSAESAGYVVPDRASIRVGTEVTASTALKAQEDSAEKTNRVIEAMKDRGIDEKNITTEDYNMWENYDRNGNRSGYRVSVTILVNDQPIDSVGDLISALSAAGADRFVGLSFYASNYEDAYEEAMAKAIDNASHKASVFAAAAGKEIGEVKAIIEGYQDTTYAVERSFAASVEEAAFDAAKESISIEPGEAKINARVTVTYRLR